MKQAVIKSGGKQYIVKEGQELDVELVGAAATAGKQLEFEPLLIFDETDVQVGTPIVKDGKVSAEVTETVKGDKIKVFKFKAKKRVKTLTGHRQKYSRIKITKIV